MTKLSFCAPVKFEHLLFWSRNRSRRDETDIRWQIVEKDDEKGIIVVELTKGKNQSLGLTISGGTDKPTPPIVANVRSGGLADKSDYFCVGDKILEINEQDITKLRHGEIIRFIQDAGKRLRFKMAYKKIRNEKSTIKSVILKLCKEDNEPKFKLRGGKSKDGLVIRPVFISELEPKSELARTGEILDGDVVLAINGKNVEGLHISEAKTLLKQADTEYKLQTQIEVDQTEIEETQRGSIFVELLRPTENIDPGLSLDVSLEHEQLGSIIIISEIKESGISSRTGALSVGDLVLAINSISMDGMSVDQARQIMLSSSKKIQLDVLPAKPKSKKNIEEPTKRIEEPPKRNILEKLPERDIKAFKCETLPPMRANLKQYPSRLSLTSQRRPNNQDRTVGAKTPDMAYSTLRSLSYKRGNLPSARQASFDDSRSLMSVCSTLSQCNLGNMLSKTEFMSVVLISDDGDFGIEVQDGLGSADNGCIVICSVTAGKAADRSGVLQIGDRIVSVNGIRTDFMSYEEFQRVVFDSATSLRLEVDFDITDSITPSSGTFAVKIPRSENTGIVLAATHEDDPDRWHRVVEIRKGSVAYRLGILQRGDQIVDINGTSTNSMPLYDANEMVRKCSEVMRINVKKDEEVQGNIFAVEFDRRGKQLGITISGSEEPFGPIYITSISEEGVAGRSGAVLVGDRLLAINEETLRGKPLWKAYSMLRTNCDIVKLLIKRTSSSVLSSASKENPPEERNSLEMVTPSKDVQKWVMSTSQPSNCFNTQTGVMSHIKEQERCPTSSNSGSTESYCDISDAGDTQSSVSDHQTRPRKKSDSVTRRPILPAWQRECMKNYNGQSNSRLEELTKSDNFSPKFKTLTPELRSYSGTISPKTAASNSSNTAHGRSKAVGGDRGSSFSWKSALSTEPKEFVIYNDGDSAGSEDDCTRDNGDNRGDTFLRSGSFSKTRSPPSSRFSSKRGKASSLHGERTRNSKGVSSLNRQSSGRGSHSAYAYDQAESEVSNSASSLAISPFQFELPSKSERYLRDLERKTEAQYNDIMEKLEKSSSELHEQNDGKISRNCFTPVKLARSDDKTAQNYFTPIEPKKPTSPMPREKGRLSTEARDDDIDFRSLDFMSADNTNDDKLPEDPVSVTSHRILITKSDADEDFGFSIAEKIDGSGIFVKSIQPGASRGRRPTKLKKYDRIMQVNGIHTRDLSCDQVVPLLQRAGRRLQLVVERVNKD